MTEVLEARTETRRRRKAERPQEILEAAFVEFSRNGYAMTTLDQIAERAGVTKGTIYVYFENKEHLFISMVREVTKATFDTVHEMLETHEGTTADLLRAQFSFIYQHIVEDRRRREVLRMLIAEAPRLPRLRLSSIDVAEIDQPLLDALGREKRLMPHLHLSLQAGDDVILKRMKRRHSRADSVAFASKMKQYGLRPGLLGMGALLRRTALSAASVVTCDSNVPLPGWPRSRSRSATGKS